MKTSFIKKLEVYVAKYAHIPGILIIISVIDLYMFAPVAWKYDQKSGIVTNIFKEEIRQYAGRTHKPYRVDAICIQLDNVDSVFFASKDDMRNIDLNSIYKKRVFIYYYSLRFTTVTEVFSIAEFVMDNKIVFTADENLYKFYRCLVIFTVCLIWCVWAFSIYWKKDEKQELKDKLQTIRNETQRKAKLQLKKYDPLKTVITEKPEDMKMGMDMLFTYNYYKLMWVFHLLLLLGNFFLIYSINTYIYEDNISDTGTFIYHIGGYALKAIIFSVLLFSISILWLRILFLFTKNTHNPDKRRLMQWLGVCALFCVYTGHYIRMLVLTGEYMALFDAYKISVYLCLCFLFISLFFGRCILFARNRKKFSDERVISLVYNMKGLYLDYGLISGWVICYLLTIPSPIAYLSVGYHYLLIFVIYVIVTVRLKLIHSFYIPSPKRKMPGVSKMLGFFKYFIIFLLIFYMIFIYLFPDLSSWELNHPWKEWFTVFFP